MSNGNDYERIVEECTQIKHQIESVDGLDEDIEDVLADAEDGLDQAIAKAKERV